MEEIIYSVSQLNNEIKHLLEEQFFFIQVEGEISNFTCPSSGHWYFTLKDETAQVRCAMFRLHHQKSSVSPENGAHVLVQAKVSLYPQRGEYQLIVQQMEHIGEGILQKRFEALKKQLFQEGLFDTEHKKPLPPYPLSIGVITSPTGAAIRDILSVLNRRFPLATVIIYPTLVQGQEATANIIRMIQLAQQRHECEVLILARGGGSIEDLWCFNEESVARAIFACTLPLITGIGHEIDFTIADFVADLRAPTPSAAAETISPDQQELHAHLEKQKRQLNTLMTQELKNYQHQLTKLNMQLDRRHPINTLLQQQQYLDDMQQRIIVQMRHKLAQKTQKITALSRELQAFNPSAILERGYAVVYKGSHVIKDIKSLTMGDTLHVTLASGKFSCNVIDEPLAQ
jgi:exodeoxyribonuclease VII large subunit